MAATKKTSKKAAESAAVADKKTRTTARKTTTKTNTAEKESIEIDINSFDWGDDCKLTEKQKLFVVWFTYPGRTYHNALQSAIKAGYTKKTAKVESGRMRRVPEIAAFIKRFDEVFVKETLEDFFHNALQDKITRASFDIRDFYEEAEYTDDDGRVHRYITIKDPSKLTPAQRKCIDGIQFEGKSGTPNFKFADRQHEIEFLMKLRSATDSEKKESNFETELTLEQIKDKVTAKVKVIQKKDEEELLAGKYIDEPENLIEEA